jgi:hypothetical protein
MDIELKQIRVLILKILLFLNIISLYTEALRHLASAALAPRKSPLYPLDVRLGGHQSRSGRCGEEKNLVPHAGNRTPAV